MRPEARPRHAAAALRARGPARQDRRATSASTRPTCARRTSQPPELRSPPTSCASARWVSAPASTRSSRRSGWRERRGKLPCGPRARPRLLLLHLRRGAADLLEPHAAVGRPAEARPRRRRRRSSAARPRSARARDSVLASVVAEVLGIDPFDIRVVTADTDLTPVDLGSYSSRVTLMMGNAALQAAERAREIARRRPRRRSSRSRRARLALRRAAASSTPTTPTKGMTLRRGGRRSPRRGSARSAPSAPTRRRRPPGRYRGAGVGPSPAYSYSAAVVEVEVDPETGIVHGPEGLDRARHRQVHQPGARRWARSRAPSTWASARR